VSAATVATLALGALLIVVYLISSLYLEKKATLGNAGVIFLSCGGLVSGVKLILFVFDPRLQALASAQQIDLPYIVLGRLALIWVSAVAIAEVFQKMRA
jgi:hypothetical protein